MARLTGQEALDYMRNNPGAFNVVQTNIPQLQQFMTPAQSAPQSQGFLGDLIGGLIKPITDFGSNTINSLGYLGNIGSGLLSGKGFGEVAQTSENFQPILGSQEDWSKYMANPLTSSIQDSAGLLSLAVPAGGGFGNAIKSGVLSGALSGFSNVEDFSDPGQALTDIGLGALAGGGTAGALQGVTNFLGNKLSAGAQQIGDDVSKGNIFRANRLGLDSSKFASPEEAQRIGAQAIGFLDNRGFATGTKQSLANSISKAKNAVNNELSTALAASEVKFPLKTMAQNIREELSIRPDILKKPDVAELLTRMENAGDNASAALTNELKFQAQNQLTPYYKSLDKSPDITAAERGLKSIRDSLDTELKTSPQLQQYAPLMKESSIYSEVQPFVGKSAQKGTNISSPMIGGNIKLPIGGITERAQDVAGRFIGGNLPQGLSKVNNILGSQAMQKVAPLLAANIASTLGDMPQNINEFQIPTEPSSQGGMMGGNQVSQTDKVAVLQGLLQQGYKPTEAIALANFISPAEKPMTAAEKEMQRKMGFGLQALDVIDQLGGADNPIQGILPQFLKGNEQKMLDSAKLQLSEAIGRLQSGGAIGEQEAARFIQLIPSWQDDAQTKQFKSGQLRQLLGGFAQPQQQQYNAPTMEAGLLNMI